MVTECDFQKMYNEYYPKIIRYLSRIAGTNDAEDLAQEVFDKINRNLSGFKGESKISTWIYRIATNTAIDRVRSASYKQALDSAPLKDTSGCDSRNTHHPSEPLSQDQAVIRKEMGNCITEYIDKLPLNYKTVLVLSELKDLSNQEIADILGISLDNVKIRLHRARTKLKEMLSDGCNFYHNEKNVFSCDRKHS